jgi:TRAP-type uncharacterized transport system substrate-binding protein
MKSKFIVGLISLLLVLLTLVFVPVSCDIATPQKSFRLAVPTTEYFYNYIAGHLKPFLEKQGYSITIVPAESTLEANRMVAEGKAELAMVNNHSTRVALKLGDRSSQLRTVMPVTTRMLYAFSKDRLPDSATALQLFQNKRVAIEFLGGETHLTLQRFLEVAKIDSVTFVTFEEEADVVVFWGKYYGERAEGWYKKGWHPYSFTANFVDFIMLNDPAIRPFRLPAFPGNVDAIITNTLATDVILVANKDLGENACYLLALAMFQNKADLLHLDIMYRSISESFDKENLLFPLHEGTHSYLLRDQPSFFERYAESLALVISLVAVAYGGVQAVQSRLRRNRKENIDKYFLEFLEIRSNKSVSREERVLKLDDLFQRAVVQLTNEKLDKGDFHILSRLIQQDLTMLRFDKLT